MKILLVSPAFHGYWHAFEAALEVLGHEAITHCYDAGDWVGNAIAHRFERSSLAARVRARATARTIDVLRRERPDAVVVVKGDALGPEWWDALAGASCRTAIWLYDELARMDYDHETLRTAEHVWTYSPADARSLRAHDVPADVLLDGFDSLTPYTPRSRDVVTFIGARYPERERLVRALAAAGEAVEVTGREWSRHPWDVLRTRRWEASGVPAGRDVGRAEYYGIMAGSLATLNIHGDGHDGFSMRTFEAPGVGALHLIDRPDVAQHYDVGTESLVFTTDDELIEHVRHARREPAWAQGIRDAGRRRTLAEHTLVHRMGEVAARWA